MLKNYFFRVLFGLFWLCCISITSSKADASGLWAWINGDPSGSQIVSVRESRGLVVNGVKGFGAGIYFIGGGRDGANKPGFQIGLTLSSAKKGGPYHTDLPIIGLDQYQSGSQIYGNLYRFSDPYVRDQEFYLAAVLGNTRTGGQREAWGIDGTTWLRLDQQRDSATFKLTNQPAVKITPNGAIPPGIILLELWRDQNNEIFLYANGEQVSYTNLVLPGQLTLTGFGYDGVGTSQWDDYVMELLIWDGLPDVPSRIQIRNYMNEKWGLWPDE